MFEFAHLKTPKIVSKEIRNNGFTPINILSNLDIDVLLESAYTQTGKGRYSIMILNHAFILSKKEDSYTISHHNGEEIDLKKIDSNRDYLDWIEYFRDINSVLEICNYPLPLGGIGYLGYEFFNEIEEIKFNRKKLLNMPECCFIFGRDFVIFDHLYDKVLLCCVSYACEDCEINLDSRIKDIEYKITNLKIHSNNIYQHEYKIISKDKKDDFIENLRIIKNEIYKGNLLQCVLSQSMQISSTIPPLKAYINLRHSNPSPYMFYFKFNDFILFGASPEVMVKLQNNKLSLKPIAGTRKRGESIAKDLALEAELLADQKELAEHLMLLDLGRNDLGKISIPGSVEVVSKMVIERYSKVMHIVSLVESNIESKFDFRDAIKATFPAGTVSGAPKIAAIKMIETLEPHSREFYAGMIGYIDKYGNLDSAITIRSAVYKNGVYYLQAGAGIVYDSNEELEYLETQNKMQALLESITKGE